MEFGLVSGLSSAYVKEQELWEYLLVVHPDIRVYNKLMAEKEFFSNQYKQKIAIKTKPHITVANFLAKQSMEETLLRYIQRICNMQKSFEVTLNNYSGFPPHTVYVRVQDPAPFKQLAVQLKAINQYVQSNGCPEVKLITKPHLTIARRLPDNIYSKAMLDYSQKTFHETFQVNELILLKRSNQFDSCKQVNVFRLYPPDMNIHVGMA